METQKQELHNLIKECTDLKYCIRKMVIHDLFIVFANIVIVYAVFVFKPSIVDFWLRILHLAILIWSTFIILRYGAVILSNIIDYYKLNIIHKILLEILNKPET